jgi:hypothetical protein
MINVPQYLCGNLLANYHSKLTEANILQKIYNLQILNSPLRRIFVVHCCAVRKQVQFLASSEIQFQSEQGQVRLKFCSRLHSFNIRQRKSYFEYF